MGKVPQEMAHGDIIDDQSLVWLKVNTLELGVLGLVKTFCRCRVVSLLVFCSSTGLYIPCGCCHLLVYAFVRVSIESDTYMLRVVSLLDS